MQWWKELQDSCDNYAQCKNDGRKEKAPKDLEALEFMIFQSFAYLKIGSKNLIEKLFIRN